MQGAGTAVAAVPRLFIVHAAEDRPFVEGFLLKALELPEGSVLVSSRLQPGEPIVCQIERGAMSLVTVVVVSPHSLESRWAQFASVLAAHQSVAAADGGVRLVPALMTNCEVPLFLQHLEPLDFRSADRGHWEAEAAKLRRKLRVRAPAVAVVPCPYPGLRPFEVDDAAFFHGRDQEVTELLGRLRDGARELYVIGPSGSGKSSLVAAGLIATLRATPALAGGAFLVRALRPGADPVAALAGALASPEAARPVPAQRGLGDSVSRLLARHPGHDRLLIVVDQLEELFTTSAPAAREAFEAALRELRREARVSLVLTLRADFYGALMGSGLWADLRGQLARLDVSPLRGRKLREAVEAPARKLGVYFEPALVERLVSQEVAKEPGALPLLQDTLLVLWHRRARGLLRLADYEALGDGTQTGLALTLRRRADTAVDELSSSRRAIARRVFLRLVQFGEGSSATRRQQSRAALTMAGDAPAEVDAVVCHLAERRLITLSGGDQGDQWARIDLAHEVILTAWTRLGDWIRTHREDERRRRVLEGKAAEWVTAGRGLARLLDADELQELRGWLREAHARELGVSQDALDLVSRSEETLAALVAEAARRRRQWQRWVTTALVALGGAVVTVSTLVVIARRSLHEASEQARVADEQSMEARRQLARNYVLQGQALLLEDRPAHAAPYLVAAREAGAGGEALGMLFRWASQGLPQVRLAHTGGVLVVAWSPDGARVATASEDGTARVWDAATGIAVSPALEHQNAVTWVAWSPDGRRVATASRDRTARVWDAATGGAVTPPLVHKGRVVRVAWSPAGGRVATASLDGTARVWEAATGLAVTPTMAHNSGVTRVEWSPDGRRVVTGSLDGTARVWNAVTGIAVTPALTHQGWVNVVAWSPDGRRVATAGCDGTARVWDAKSGAAVTPALAHKKGVTRVAWSPDGQRVATGGEDGTARVWEAASGAAVTSALAHKKAVTWVAWSPDGRRVATASEDGTARVWDARSGVAETLALQHHAGVYAVAWSPDGERVATASRDGTARVWDPATGMALTPVLAHKKGVTWVAWSPDGRWVATASYDGTARVWDARSRAAVTTMQHKGWVTWVAWSPDGRRVATASHDRSAQVWDATSGAAVTPALAHKKGVTWVAWSPDGRRVATASQDGTARVWDATSGAAVTPALAHKKRVTWVAWSPRGGRVATASEDGTARVWDATSGAAMTPALAHAQGVTSVAWSPDGGRVATASRDGTARVWDAGSGAAVTAAMAHQSKVVRVAWSPDGRRVATASEDGSARVWDVQRGTAVTPAMLHQKPVTWVAWSPDGRRVATASEDGTARVWDATSGAAVTPPMEHKGGWFAVVVWSPDGKRVATASDVGARVWDATSGAAVTPVMEQKGGSTAVAWSPDGRRVATASEDGTVRVWDASWDTGTLADWHATLTRDDYRLNLDGVLVEREPSAPRFSIPSFRLSSSSAQPDPP